MSEQENNISKLLDEVITLQQHHEKIKNSNGESFNIFSILKMQRKEVKTHSIFIYELLNPNGSHGQGDIFLKLFIEHVLNMKKNIGKNFIVKREDATAENKRIDLTIESDNYLFGIEIKIDALDIYKQLFSYHEELKNRTKGGKRFLLFYLTLNGKEASKDSLYGLSENDYQCISFQNEIITWLDFCIKEMALKHVIREALLQYKILIELLTKKMRGIQMDIENILLNDIEKLKAAIQIESTLTPVKIKLQTKFWEELKNRLKKEGKGVKEYGIKPINNLVKDYYEKSRSKKNFGLKFHIHDFKGKKVYAYINIYKSIHYGLRIEDNLGKLVKDTIIKNELRENLGIGNAMPDKYDSWIICFYTQEKINFYNLSSYANLVADDNELNKLITGIISHIHELENKL